MRTKTGPMVLVVVVAMAVGGLFAWRTTSGGSNCGALNADVAGLESWDDANGVTSYGPDWVRVLTLAPTHADEASREAIAAAVEGDQAGFDRFRSALPGELEQPADRLRALALDPAAPRQDAEVDADAEAINLHVTDACGVVL